MKIIDLITKDTREFDSFEIKKTHAGLAVPVNFLSTFLFLGIAIYRNV